MKTINFVSGPGGSYIKSRGTRGTKMSENADLITVETYVQQDKIINNPFFIYGPECEQKFTFWAIWGPWSGPSMIKLCLSCFPAIPSPTSMKQSDKSFLSLNPKYEETNHIWRALTSNTGERIFRAARPHHRADI